MDNSSRKIRVAVLTRSDSMEMWEVNALKAVKTLPFVEIVLQVADGTPGTKKSFGQKLAGYKWSRLFWNRWFRKYGKVNATEELLFAGDNVLAEIFNTVPRCSVVPELKGKFSQHFSADDLAMVKSYSPDVILRFGFNILRGEILTVAKHGVWSFHHADPETIRGGPASFWEYVLGHHVTSAILQRLTAKLDDGVILRSGYWPLVRHSFRENLDSLLNNTSGWIANALTEIHLNGKIANKKTAPVKGKVYSYPGNFRMIQFWLILFGNKIAFHWNNLFRPETWQIGIIDQPVEDVVKNGITGKIRWLRAKRNDSYLADPFAMEYNGREIIVSEYFCGTNQRSHIVNAETEEIVLKQDYHLSFPQAIDIDEQAWLLTEMSASGTHDLFLLSGLPNSKKLVDAPLVDPVMLYHNGRWWIFTHRQDDQNNSALFIYHAENVDKGFEAHPLNPVKTDIRNSRSAGAMLNIDGKLIRPAQDSAITYGNAIVLNEIEELTPTSYLEKPIKRIGADPAWEYNKGIHTINAYGNKTLIDVKSFRFNFANFKAQFSRKARRISGK